MFNPSTLAVIVVRAPLNGVVVEMSLIWILLLTDCLRRMAVPPE